jgi:asparagine synthetase B (glutamine-hydrolysing)
MDVFLKSPAFRSESAWIGNETPYEGIMHLPPNHYLDITGNKVERFWPYAERSKTKLSDAADIMATLLKGTYEAAVKRYKLHQGLTSGWDTRVLLAASRQHVKEIKFYFLAGFKNEKQGVLRDRRVAVEIAEKTGIPLDIYNFNEVSTDPQFEKIFYANNILARPKLLLYITSVHLN